MGPNTISAPETGDLKELASRRRASGGVEACQQKGREGMIKSSELNKETPKPNSCLARLFHRTSPPPEGYLETYQTARERYARAYNVSVWAMAKRHENERRALMVDLDGRRTKREAELASRRDYCPWRWSKPEDQVERACIHHACISKRVAHLQFTSRSCTYCVWHHLLRAHSREACKLYDEHHGKARAAYRECRRHVSGTLVRWEPPAMKTEPARDSLLQVTDWTENARGQPGRTRRECAEQVQEWEVRVGRCCADLFTLREMFVDGEGLC
jgi:hypothetical protein